VLSTVQGVRAPVARASTRDHLAASQAGCGAEAGPRRRLACPLTAYRTFHALHAPHGPLVFGADEPDTTGYPAWAACPCWAAWERWISLAEVLGDLDAGDHRRVAGGDVAHGRRPSTERRGRRTCLGWVGPS
jgi:hypothetical protein